MNRASLYPRIRRHVQAILNGYINMRSITTEAINDFICPSIWGPNAGIIGALSLGLAAWERERGYEQLREPANEDFTSRLL
jgi:fructokinase